MLSISVILGKEEVPTWQYKLENCSIDICRICIINSFCNPEVQFFIFELCVYFFSSNGIRSMTILLVTVIFTYDSLTLCPIKNVIGVDKCTPDTKSNTMWSRYYRYKYKTDTFFGPPQFLSGSLFSSARPTATIKKKVKWGKGKMFSFKIFWLIFWNFSKSTFSLVVLNHCGQF